MKKVLSQILMLVFVISLAYAQEKTNFKIPNVVKEAFAKKNPSVTKAKWETEQQNYEVAFKLNGKSISELYDAKGVLLETEESIDIKDLPAPVASKVKDYKFKELAKITKANGSVVYEVEVKGKDLLFDISGNAVKL